MNTQHSKGIEPLRHAGHAPDRIVKEPERRACTSLCRTAAWQQEKEGTFPRRVRIGKRGVGWRMSELQAWVRGEWKPEGEQ